MRSITSALVILSLASESDGAHERRSSMENMNGDYILSQTPKGKDTQRRFPTHYRDYPGGVISFDVYSPLVKTLYSQVWWKPLEPVSLPDDIVKRFDGKGMAVVGFELDQVRKTDKGDVSVPMTVTYNHHFESTMIGKGASFRKTTRMEDPHAAAHDMGHGMPDEYYVVEEEEEEVSDQAFPTRQDFGGANGGEVRKSFHGYAPGYVQVIGSPTSLQVTPMQIDTWHREKMNISYPTKFVPGPLPRSSWAPKENPTYSGLLECPVTTRIQKKTDGGHFLQRKSVCDTPVDHEAECWDAARATVAAEGLNFTTTVVSDSRKPRGCSAQLDPSDKHLIHVYYNKLNSSTVACGSGTKTISGAAESLVSLSVDLDVTHEIATITMTGPQGVWFGVGFGAQAMQNAPWAIIVDGSGNVTERKLGYYNPGKQLERSITVVSSTSTGTHRTVVMTRPFQGKSKDYFTFRADADPTLKFINAVGSGPTLAYHKAKSPASLALLTVANDPAAPGGDCVCAAKPKPFGEGFGTLQYVKTSQAADIGGGGVPCCNHCTPQPRSDLLAQRNPTCDIRTYTGGQIACHHMFSLLDADQEIPWADQPLEYYLKFRFWVQEYNASYHTQVLRDTWGIASPVEYDVPKCGEGVAGCSRAPDGSWIHTIAGTYSGHSKLVAAHFHCHAPTCLAIAMYRCPAGTKVCNATTGELLCEERTVSGGTGAVDEGRFDEPGYILQPPCLWGSPDFGLEEPPDVTGYVLGTVKTSNATYGHHGEMAWLQMYLAPATPGKPVLDGKRPFFV